MRLADLKRAMIPGSKWETIHYRGGIKGVRTIAKANSVGVKFRNAEDQESYLDWPKASEMRFVDGWIELWPAWYVEKGAEVPLLKYKQVND